MRKQYYIVTANSSEPEIFHPKDNPNTLIFAKARCRWDYAEKVSGCDDCLEEKRRDGKMIFRIVESEFQHGKSNFLAIFNARGVRRQLNLILSFGPVNNKIYLVIFSILFSMLLSSFLWYFDILEFSNPVFGMIAFLISWIWF